MAAADVLCVKDKKMGEFIYRVWDVAASDNMPERTKENLAPYRKLWDDIFADPEGFADYYFEEVCKKNIIIGVYDAEVLIGMAYANPYTVRDSEQSDVQDSYYIVGVAVEEAYRRQGIMRRMMQCLMQYLSDKSCKLVFLMPENEQYYSSLGFENIYKTETITVDVARLEPDMPLSPTVKMLHLSRLPKEEWQLLADGINNELSKQYRYYVNRDADYLQRMLSEHQCQKGDVAIVYDAEAVRGIFAYGLDGRHMYIERMEVFGNTYSEMLATVVVRVASFMKCEACSVTVDAGQKEQFCEAFHGDCDIKAGHGIMACPLDTSTFSIENLKNKSFFDEIV